MIGKWHVAHDTGHGRDWDHSIVWDQADIRGDWYNDQLLSIDGAAKKVVPGYSTDLYTKFAVDYLKRDHAKPWLLWLCYNAPHNPRTIAPRHKDRYPDGEVSIPSDIFPPRPGKPKYMQTYTQWKKAEGDDPLKTVKVNLPNIVRAYNRMICAVDEGVGQLLKALEETGQLDNTLIVFTSDQGFAWGDHGFAWKVGPYDACMRMPLIVRLPGVAAKGAVCRHPVGLIDLPPTIFALAGAEVPWAMHGHDLRPILKDPRAEWSHPVVLEHFRWAFGAQTDRGVTGADAFQGVPWWLSLRQGKHKYIRTLVPDEIEELYDLDADPREQKNLALVPAQGKLLADYRQRLLDELKRTRAGLVANLPPPKVAP